MYAALAVLTLALAPLAPLASALVIPRKTPPSTYAVGYLENYDTYNKRYIALNCEFKHGSMFFADCCHPMLATENLKDNRKPYCTPSASASSSAAQAFPTSTVEPSAPVPVNVAPSPSSSSKAEPSPSSASASPKPTPEPTPSPSPSPSPSPAPAPSPSPSSSGNNNGGLGAITGSVHEGIATFFYQNGVAGNCGAVHLDADFVVALPTSTYANGAFCGKKVVVMDADTGHTEFATVADSCPTCGGPDDLDMSVALFSQFATLDKGIFNLKWAFAQ